MIVSASLRRGPRVLRALPALAAAALALAGCEAEDDDFDHDPPPGLGTLYVVNRTFESIDVYVDGARLPGVGRDDDRYYDLEPGVRRVVLDEQDGARSFRGDVDVLAGRRTIIDVTSDPLDDARYDVFIYFD